MRKGRGVAQQINGRAQGAIASICEMGFEALPAQEEK